MGDSGSYVIIVGVFLGISWIMRLIILKGTVRRVYKKSRLK